MRRRGACALGAEGGLFASFEKHFKKEKTTKQNNNKKRKSVWGGGGGRGWGGLKRERHSFTFWQKKRHCGSDKAGAAMGRLCSVRRPFKKRGNEEK